MMIRSIFSFSNKFFPNHGYFKLSAARLICDESKFTPPLPSPSSSLDGSADMPPSSSPPTKPPFYDGLGFTLCGQFSDDAVGVQKKKKEELKDEDEDEDEEGVGQDGGGFEIEEQLQMLEKGNLRLCKYLEGRDIVIEACESIQRRHSKVLLHKTDIEQLMSTNVVGTTASLFAINRDKIMDTLTNLVLVCSGTEFGVKLGCVLYDTLNHNKGLDEALSKLFSKYSFDNKVEVDLDKLMRSLREIQHNMDAIEETLKIRKEDGGEKKQGENKKEKDSQKGEKDDKEEEEEEDGKVGNKTSDDEVGKGGNKIEEDQKKEVDDTSEEEEDDAGNVWDDE